MSAHDILIVYGTSYGQTAKIARFMADQLRETRRDFSHGCIRVADPAALAGWVLRGQGAWNADSIAREMTDAWSRRVPVTRPVDVFVLYATVVQGDDGLVRFYPDLYGHDAALARALRLPPVAALAADAP